MARLLADENMPGPLVQALIGAGHDVATVIGLGLQGASDEAVLNASNQDARILMTADKDFGLILESGPLADRGRVMLLRYAILNWERIAREVTSALTIVEKEFRADARLLVVLSEGRCRVRHSTSGG